MKIFSEVPINADVPDCAESLEESIDCRNEWIDHIDLPDESNIWQDSIDLSKADFSVLREKDSADAIEGDYPSTYKERMDQTPKDDRERGDWHGERGESSFTPNDEEMKSLLDEHGIDSIEYKNAIPDFSPCSESTVTIDNMTDNRSSNFQQCDQRCAEQWNMQCRGNRSDWTARDVANWRRENDYSWHERNDIKTCDLIPTKVNAYFGHLGGVGEYIRLSNKNIAEGIFDE